VAASDSLEDVQPHRATTASPGSVTAVGEATVRRSIVARAIPIAARTISFVPLGFMAGVVVLTFAAVLWTLRRGFGWGDEAFIYTMIASSRRAIGEPWGFQHLLHPLYLLTGESVLAFRFLRLVGYSLLSGGLVWSARFVVSRMVVCRMGVFSRGVGISRSGWVFILLFAQVGTFLAWSEPVRSLGYNELASWFTQLGVALILISLAWGVSRPDLPSPPPLRSQRAVWVLWPIWAGLGGLTILLGFAKVTSAAAFAMLLALALVVPNPLLRLWKRVLSLGVGAAVVLLLLWLSRVPIGFYVENARSLVFDTSVRDAFGHPTAGTVRTYADSLLFTGRALLPAVTLTALVMATLRRRASTARARASANVHPSAGGEATDLVTWMFGALLLVALVTLPRVDVWSYLGELTVLIGAAALLGLMALGSNGVPGRGPAAGSELMPASAVSRALPVAVAGIAILAAPFISAVGTSNRITGQLIFAATLWAVVLGTTLVLLTQRATELRSRARALPILLGCVVTLLASLAVQAAIVKPYQMAPLLSQDTSTSVPEFRGILLTAADAAWVDWLSTAGDSLHARDVPAVAIDSSGALFAFNHSGYANPWVGKNWPSAYKSLTFVCRKDPPADLFVLQPGRLVLQPRLAVQQESSIAGVTKSLAACGIRFPGSFRVVDRRVTADAERAMTIWRLKPGTHVAPGSAPGFAPG